MATTPTNTMLATPKRPMLLNNFAFNFLYIILSSPYLDFKDKNIL